MDFHAEEGKLISFTVAADGDNRTAQEYLQKVKKISAKAVTRIKHHGTVRINGQNALLKQLLKEGDLLEIVYPHEASSPYLQPEFVPLDIIYEDDSILVLNKQFGVCVHPTKGHPHQTLANGVLYHWATNKENGRIHLINRLDKDTSGLVLLAKHTYEAQQLFAAQQKGGIKRAYLALTNGVVPEEEGTLDSPIARVEGRTTKRYVADHGQSALTHYKVRQRFANHTLLEIILGTGRTHQIRVHLSHWGYPIVGDELYGKHVRTGQSTVPAGRQFLHAYHLSFPHPKTQETLSFTLELPGELQAVLENI